MVNPDAPEPVYQQLAEILESKIRSGELSGRLPGEREMAEIYGVSYGSVRHAMKLLREAELIRTIHGRGTFAVPPG